MTGKESKERPDGKTDQVTKISLMLMLQLRRHCKCKYSIVGQRIYHVNSLSNKEDASQLKGNTQLWISCVISL